MDLSAALALVSTAAGGAATAAGESAWRALRGVLGRFVGRPGEPALELPESDAAEQVAEFRARIAQLAAENGEFRAALEEWASAHEEPLTSATAGEVHNVLGDQATVHGSVVQLRDVQGDLHIG